MIDVISDMAFQQLENFGFRHSANLAWALATLEKTNEPLLTAMAVAAAANVSDLSPLSLASTAWACVSMKIIYFPLLDAMSELLFQSPVDDGIATMAIWSLSRLPDLDRAFLLVDSAKWRIPPLSLSALLEACEQRDLAAGAAASASIVGTWAFETRGAGCVGRIGKRESESHRVTP